MVAVDEKFDNKLVVYPVVKICCVSRGTLIEIQVITQLRIEQALEKHEKVGLTTIFSQLVFGW